MRWQACGGVISLVFGLNHEYNLFLTEEVRGHVLPEVQEDHLVQRHQGVLAHPENKEKTITSFGLYCTKNNNNTRNSMTM